MLSLYCFWGGGLSKIEEFEEINEIVVLGEVK